jgi:hypothetical protein
MLANAAWNAVLAAVLLMAIGSGVLGQSSLSPLQREQLGSVPQGLPGDLLVQAAAVGNRLRTPGKEETVLTGRFLTEFSEPKTVRVVHQLSGMVRIEGLREKIPLLFDGDLPQGALDRIDEALLETFVMDTVEGFIYSARSGGALRLLGRGFGPDLRAVREYKGPRFDIYELTAPVRWRQDRQFTTKRYYFDSATGFLVSTRSIDPSGLKVETRFSDWQQVEGSAYPGRIERFENDRMIFTYLVTTASSRPRQDAANFR